MRGFLASVLLGTMIAGALGGGFVFYLSLPRVYVEHPSGRCVWAENDKGEKIPCETALASLHERVLVAPEWMREEGR